jgi:arylsulfatase A-like enzyme
MKKRFLLITIIAVVSIQLAFSVKPNVIFFLVDDLGWKDISLTGSKLYETPNIDQLAKEGVSFTNAYAAYARCVPSRYAMITGKFPARTHIPGGGKTELSEVTIAEALKDADYATFFTGKWHLGKKETHWPQNQGFDVNKGGCGAGAPISYFYPYNEARKNGDGKLIYGLDDGVKDEFLTERLTKETVKFIKDNSDTNFFAYVAHYAVHTPIEAKQDVIDKYAKKIKGMEFEGEAYTFGSDGRHKMHQDHPVYAAMVEGVDESLGKIIEALKQEGIYDNTIIIISSDHGGLSNSGLESSRELATSNLPLRAGKGHSYEGGIKIPTIVRWNGHIEAGSTNESVIIGTDYYPTILEMVGLPFKPEQHIDGVSFVPALQGGVINEKREFFWHSPAGRPESTGDNDCSAIRIGDYKLIDFYDMDKVELYNLAIDPEEKNNLAEQNPEMTDKLLTRLNEWKSEISAVGHN